MLWPIELPFEIACWTLATVVIVLTAMAPLLKWRRGKTVRVSSALAMVALVPSCTGIMFVVDKMRFGTFEYATIQDIDDFRARRYLPPAASDITMHKQASGYRARYSISAPELHAYLDHLWDTYGEASAVERDQRLGEGEIASKEMQELFFTELGWDPFENATVYCSPVEADGGGATYYFDSNAGIVMQRTGYW